MRRLTPEQNARLRVPQREAERIAARAMANAVRIERARLRAPQRICGFPCLVAEHRLRKAVRIVLRGVRERRPQDLGRLRRKLVGFRPYDQTMGSAVAEFRRLSCISVSEVPRQDEDRPGVLLAQAMLDDDNARPGWVCLPDPSPAHYTPADICALVAHELGHAATSPEDIERRRLAASVVDDEWLSEGMADYCISSLDPVVTSLAA